MAKRGPLGKFYIYTDTEKPIGKNNIFISGRTKLSEHDFKKTKGVEILASDKNKVKANEKFDLLLKRNY